MKRFLIALLLWLSIAFPAYAAERCRPVNDQEVCIVSIRRSAKNYWEYRAIVKVDGAVKPLQIYDCRSKTTIQDNKVLELFEQDGTAEAVCSFFKPPRDAFGVANGKPRIMSTLPTAKLPKQKLPPQRSPEPIQ
ncbi:MAG: hypothetical protein J0L70_04030 [Leptolyngbya sp. UWPOB_LEPTO1]|uniref:hypothetical protein n=1 Tax=Leptolyngbya sp. UWPOB_LEPTO1 TaxID=2815653 RepID=UPI001AC8B30E|nr:hypothetical protein [Leptolyngbya sp. UWPOB_LEPTO1]MBN8559671.1 hypothetical protein [Leptolyngbya sp. UWPOB_LEPTO1]